MGPRTPSLDDTDFLGRDGTTRAGRFKYGMVLPLLAQALLYRYYLAETWGSGPEVTGLATIWFWVTGTPALAMAGGVDLLLICLSKPKLLPLRAFYALLFGLAWIVPLGELWCYDQLLSR